jgi:hypothetical protein
MYLLLLIYVCIYLLDFNLETFFLFGFNFGCKHLLNFYSIFGLFHFKWCRLPSSQFLVFLVFMGRVLSLLLYGCLKRIHPQEPFYHARPTGISDVISS